MNGWSGWSEDPTAADPRRASPGTRFPRRAAKAAALAEPSQVSYVGAVIGVRAQLAWLVGVFVSVSLIGLALFAAREDRREKSADAIRGAAHALSVLAHTVEFHVREGNDEALAQLLEVTIKDPRGPEFLGLQVRGPKQVIGDAGASAEFITKALATREPIYEQHGSELFVAHPSFNEEGRTLVIGHVSLRRTEEAVTRSRNRLISGAVTLAALLALGLFVGLSRMMVRPLKALQAKALALGHGKLDERVEVKGGRELRELAETLNRMAAALQTSHAELEARVEERTRELTAVNKRLEQLAVTDGLTGVFNHRRFQEALDQEVLRTMRTTRPLSVLMIDVDHFKRFNDEYGHPAGDDLLRKLAATLQAELRATDLLARYGGEEFAVILPETSPELARQVAERLRAAVQTKINADQPDRQVTISVGIATRRDNQGPEELLSAADTALYAAKNGGRNQVKAA